MPILILKKGLANNLSFALNKGEIYRTIDFASKRSAPWVFRAR